MPETDEAEPESDSTASATEPAADDEETVDIVEDLVEEELRIDGICGVY